MAEYTVSPEIRKKISNDLWLYSFISPEGIIPPCYPRLHPSDRYCELFGYMRRNT